MNKKLVLIFVNLIVIFNCFGISICSWNIQNIGKSKSDKEIQFIAKVLKEYDIVAIQEVVAGEGGAQAIAKLHNALNRTGYKWDYVISDPTSGDSYSRERYAFLWKTSITQKVGDAWLNKKYQSEFEREPFFATFKSKGKLFTLVTFHAIPKSKQPETEIKYFKFLPSEYPNLNLIFCGDFNCSQSHNVFAPLKTLGYKPTLVNQKTSLRQKCMNGNCLASEYDNFFYKESTITFLKSGVILFFKEFVDYSEAKKISDHTPIFFSFDLK